MNEKQEKVNEAIRTMKEYCLNTCCDYCQLKHICTLPINICDWEEIKMKPIKQAKRKRKLNRRKRVMFIMELLVLIALALFTIGMNIVWKYLGWGLVLLIPSALYLVFVCALCFVELDHDEKKEIK